MEQKIEALYNAPCGGETSSCNCFLHSYNVPNTRVTEDLYDSLKPFVDHIVSIHDDALTLDIYTLKGYAKTFAHPELDFEGANFF